LETVPVYIPKQAILEQGANFLDILKAIKPSEVKAKQNLIEKIASRLQYSVVPESIKPENGDMWDSPVYDAADVIIEHILDPLTIEPLAGFGEQDLLQQKCMQNDIMQNHADYAGLFPGKTKGDVGSHVSKKNWSKNKCDNYSRESGFKASTFKIEW
jgi:hypothetical protein